MIFQHVWGISVLDTRVFASRISSTLGLTRLNQGACWSGNTPAGTLATFLFSILRSAWSSSKQAFTSKLLILREICPSCFHACWRVLMHKFWWKMDQESFFCWDGWVERFCFFLMEQLETCSSEWSIGKPCFVSVFWWRTSGFLCFSRFEQKPLSFWFLDFFLAATETV